MGLSAPPREQAAEPGAALNSGARQSTVTWEHGPKAYRNAGPSPAMPRRVLQDSDAMGAGQPPPLGRIPQLNGKTEATVSPPLPTSGHVTNATPEVDLV